MLRVIVLEGVGKHYRRGVPVLRDIDLSVPAGVATVISGGNGSGKSTLLRIVAGVLRPTSGKVRDRPRSVGYLPSPFPAELRLSATSYLRHFAAIRGLPRERGTGHAREVLTRLGFAGDADAPIRTLSKGNMHKVGLVQALLPTDGLLVLDEPWSGLDHAAQLTLDTMIGELVAAGRSVLITDHVGHALRLPDRRALALSEGRLHAQGDGSAETPAVTVELVGAGEVLATVAGFVGVRGTERLAGGLRLRVDAGTSDTVLAEALRLGASVRTVTSPERVV
ncbi:MAG TPA: ABC transporter ATP-binding protein [Pseudonocardiaceae bacterium]|nr:ABC transporter ATP-binding protein [Pseudonocardiaceae bacterium]